MGNYLGSYVEDRDSNFKSRGQYRTQGNPGPGSARLFPFTLWCHGQKRPWVRGSKRDGREVVRDDSKIKIRVCVSIRVSYMYNLSNIRCSAVSWPTLYLMQTWIMLNLTFFFELCIHITLIQIEVILNSHVQKTLCFHAFINSRNYTAVKLLQ